MLESQPKSPDPASCDPHFVLRVDLRASVQVNRTELLDSEAMGQLSATGRGRACCSDLICFSIL